MDYSQYLCGLPLTHFFTIMRDLHLGVLRIQPDLFSVLHVAPGYMPFFLLSQYNFLLSHYHFQNL